MENKKIVCAHRGASGLVKWENTIASFQKAIDVKADSIECDVRKTKDDILILNHDPDIDGYIIADYTFDELKKLTIKEGYEIASLQEGLDFCENKILIDIEMKEQGYEEKLVKQILSSLDYKDFNIRSFNDESLKKIKDIDENITTILLLGRYKPKHVFRTRMSEIFPKKRIKYTRCNAVSPYYKLLILNYVRRIHRYGNYVYAWTVDDPVLMKKLYYKKRVDGIVTNYPDKARDILDNK